MIEKEKVKKIASLARIELSEEEISIMQKDITNILDYFNILSELDVSNVPPFSFSFLNINTKREDRALESNDNIKDAFPEEKNNYLKVKEVF